MNPNKSWRTTMAGIFSIILGGIGIANPIVQGSQTSGDALTAAMAAIVAGIGLLTAKDDKKKDQ